MKYRRKLEEIDYLWEILKSLKGNYEIMKYGKGFDVIILRNEIKFNTIIIFVTYIICFIIEKMHHEDHHDSVNFWFNFCNRWSLPNSKLYINIVLSKKKIRVVHVNRECIRWVYLSYIGKMNLSFAWAVFNGRTKDYFKLLKEWG